MLRLTWFFAPVFAFFFLLPVLAQPKPPVPAKPPAAGIAPPGTPAAPAGGGEFDAETLRKIVGSILTARKLQADGRSVRARRLLAEAEKQLGEMFPPGKNFAVSAACPLMVRGRPGAQRVGLACFPAAEEGRFAFEFFRSTGVFTNKEHLTEDAVLARLEDFPIFQEFTGQIQVVQDLTGKRTFDTDGPVVYVRFLEVTPIGPGRPAPAPAPGPGAAVDAAAAPPVVPEPASLEDRSVMRCGPVLVLPADAPEKPRSVPPGPRATGEPGALSRCESSEAVCILHSGGDLSCWPKSK